MMAIETELKNSEKRDFPLPSTIRKSENFMNDAFSVLFKKYSECTSKPTTTRYYGGIWDIDDDKEAVSSKIDTCSTTADWWGGDAIKNIPLHKKTFSRRTDENAWNCDDVKETVPLKNKNLSRKIENRLGCDDGNETAFSRNKTLSSNTKEDWWCDVEDTSNGKSTGITQTVVIKSGKNLSSRVSEFPENKKNSLRLPEKSQNHKIEKYTDLMVDLLTKDSKSLMKKDKFMPSSSGEAIKTNAVISKVDENFLKENVNKIDRLFEKSLQIDGDVFQKLHNSKTVSLKELEKQKPVSNKSSSIFTKQCDALKEKGASFKHQVDSQSGNSFRKNRAADSRSYLVVETQLSKDEKAREMSINEKGSDQLPYDNMNLYNSKSQQVSLKKSESKRLNSEKASEISTKQSEPVRETPYLKHKDESTNQLGDSQFRESFQKKGHIDSKPDKNPLSNTRKSPIKDETKLHKKSENFCDVKKLELTISAENARLCRNVLEIFKQDVCKGSLPASSNGIDNVDPQVFLQYVLTTAQVPNEMEKQSKQDINIPPKHVRASNQIVNFEVSESGPQIDIDCVSSFESNQRKGVSSTNSRDNCLNSKLLFLGDKQKDRTQPNLTKDLSNYSSSSSIEENSFEKFPTKNLMKPFSDGETVYREHLEPAEKDLDPESIDSKRRNGAVFKRDKSPVKSGVSHCKSKDDGKYESVSYQRTEKLLVNKYPLNWRDHCVDSVKSSTMKSKDDKSVLNYQEKKTKMCQRKSSEDERYSDDHKFLSNSDSDNQNESLNNSKKKLHKKMDVTNACTTLKGAAANNPKLVTTSRSSSLKEHNEHKIEKYQPLRNYATSWSEPVSSEIIDKNIYQSSSKKDSESLQNSKWSPDRSRGWGNAGISWRDRPDFVPDAKEDVIMLKIINQNDNTELAIKISSNELFEIKKEYRKIGDFVPNINASAEVVPYSACAVAVLIKFLFGKSYNFLNLELALEVYSMAKTCQVQGLMETCLIFFENRKPSSLDEATRIGQFADYLDVKEVLTKSKMFEAARLLNATGPGEPVKFSFEAHSCFISCCAFQRRSEFVIPLMFYKDPGLGSTRKCDILNDIVFESLSGTYHLTSIQLKLEPEEAVRGEKLSIFYDVYKNNKLLFDEECEQKLQSLITIQFRQELVVNPGEEFTISVLVEDISVRFCHSLTEEKLTSTTPQGKCKLSFKSDKKSEAKKSLFFIEKLFYTVSN